ncbi:MAG: response regulator [Candidatus Krumholzibacteria bacterium]|nr:response regulator [Candidatus Krumholzibacteria bacterium]
MAGNILVVDDDLKVLEILEESLKKKGHDVQVARDAEEALCCYKDSAPDMIVLDIVLPDMDGRDLLKIMRSVPGAKPVPVLFLSANSDPEVMISSLNSGAEDFLVKPFSLREFNAKVKKVLGSYRDALALKERTVRLESEVSRKRESNIQINRELKRQLLSMRTLFNVSQDLNRRLDLDEMINGFALTLVGELQISSMALFTIRRERDDHFYLQGVKGFDKSRIADLKLTTQSEFAELLMTRPGPQKLVRSKDNEWVRKLPDVRLAIFEYVTPIIVKQKLKGVVFTGPRVTGKEYTSYDLDILQSICNSAGIGLDNARLFRELQNTYLSTVKALVSIIEAKDPYTKGHTERVADYSVALGKKMKLSRDEIRDVAFGAVLHDIGKLVIYEKILNKPGSLNEEEWKVLKEHPVIGANIIENMDFLSGTVAYVRHHHESYDGKGYPDGLSGEEIPIGARIISVADSYDAMTTDRPYRKALGRESALDRLREQAGSQFDPQVVDSFIALLEVDGFVARNRRGNVVAHQT